MESFRRILRHAGTAGLFVLAGLSVVGAFLGAGRAKIFFHSVPLAVFWSILAALTLAAVVSFPKLIRSPGLVGMHLGWILIVVGGMLGSDTAHRLLRPGKIPAGYMFIKQGDSDNTLHGLDSRETRGKLPFTVRLEKFDIEYYPTRQGRWRLVYQANRSGKTIQEKLAWKPGKPVKIAGTDITLRIFRPVERPGDWAPPCLRITARGATGKNAELALLMPAVVGSAATWPGPKIKLRVVRLFHNFRFVGKGREMRPIDDPSDGSNPAVELEAILPDGRSFRHFAFTQKLTEHNWPDGLDIVYLPDQPFPEKRVGQYRPCRAAALVSLTRAGDSLTRWLVVRAGDDSDAISLEGLFANRASWRSAGAPLLGLRGPKQSVREYRGELVALKNAREVARKTIEVNHPLHFGGYHFYQTDYDPHRWEYTVLFVRSDTGLWAVYAGFVLLVAGAMVRFWLGPITSYLRRRN